MTVARPDHDNKPLTLIAGRTDSFFPGHHRARSHTQTDACALNRHEAMALNAAKEPDASAISVPRS